MKDKKLAIFSIIIIIASVAVLLIAVFGPDANDTPAVLLPSVGSAAGDDGSLANVTPQTVQAVIETLDRPESYSRTLTAEDYWGASGSGSSQLQVWVSGAKTRIQCVKNGLTENILLTADGIWIWYDGQNGVFHSAKADSAQADQWMRAVSYEELLSMPKDAITGAGYSKYAGEGCVWAQYTSPTLGYRNIEYVSVSTGILMGVESYDGDKLIYRMTSGTPSVTPPDASLFEIPEE